MIRARNPVGPTFMNQPVPSFSAIARSCHPCNLTFHGKPSAFSCTAHAGLAVKLNIKNRMAVQAIGRVNRFIDIFSPRDAGWRLVRVVSNIAFGLDIVNVEMYG